MIDLPETTAGGPAGNPGQAGDGNATTPAAFDFAQWPARSESPTRISNARRR